MENEAEDGGGDGEWEIAVTVVEMAAGTAGLVLIAYMMGEADRSK